MDSEKYGKLYVISKYETDVLSFKLDGRLSNIFIVSKNSQYYSQWQGNNREYNLFDNIGYIVSKFMSEYIYNYWFYKHNIPDLSYIKISNFINNSDYLDRLLEKGYLPKGTITLCKSEDKAIEAYYINKHKIIVPFEGILYNFNNYIDIGSDIEINENVYIDAYMNIKLLYNILFQDKIEIIDRPFSIKFGTRNRTMIFKEYNMTTMVFANHFLKNNKKYSLSEFITISNAKDNDKYYPYADKLLEIIELLF
jgi:hypothetical protein